MKRHLVTAAILLTAALTLSGCGVFDQSAQQTPAMPEGFIGPAELTDSEMGLIDLFGVDAEGWGLYDFFAPEGTLFVDIRLWQLVDGAWVELSADSISTRVSDGQGGYSGRIAVRFDSETHSLEYACQLPSGTVRHDPIILGEGAEDVAWGVSSIAQEESLQPDAPSALMLISGTTGDSHTQYIPQIGFDEPELFDESHVCDYVLTIKCRSPLSE